MSYWSPAIVVVHIVWSTHGRVPLLEPQRDAELASYLANKASEVRCRLHACGSADDHVHTLAQLPSTVTLATLVQRMKGASSHDLGARWPRGLRWQDGYWARSVSPSHIPRLVRYIELQRDHHADGSAQEEWMKPKPPDPR